MKAIDLKNAIESCVDMIEFEYNGKYGNIDPYYIPEKNTQEYLLYFEGEEKYEKRVYSITDVMNTPFLDGKTLTEVAEDLEI